jgi:hypothetical protein
MKKAFAYGGIAASIVLILFGAGAIAVGALGFNEVRDTIARENITATPDATEIAGVNLVPGQKIDTGREAKEFAKIMRHHTLEATSGLTYADMGRFQSAANPSDPKGTNDETAAAKDPQGNPVSNAQRDIWVTETALTTALNTSFMAERVAVFSIVMGGALLLTGIGFLVLTLGGALGVAPVARRKPAAKADLQHTAA